MMDDDAIFELAAAHLERIHTEFTPDELLTLYALYKQATLGACNTQRPGIFNIKSRAKWDAWQALADLPADHAKMRYNEIIMSKDATFAAQIQNGEAEQTKSLGHWVVHSRLAEPKDEKAEQEKDVFDFVKEKNFARFREMLRSEDLQAYDDMHMGLIHWAADGNALDILSHLLACGANVNMRDGEGQTPLHFAASCGHSHCIELLLQHGADRQLKDSNDETCLDVAENADVRALLQIQ